jgi:hypothetical protein
MSSEENCVKNQMKHIMDKVIKFLVKIKMIVKDERPEFWKQIKLIIDLYFNQIDDQMKEI